MGPLNPLNPHNPCVLHRYHQKVPPVVPELELKATYGLAAPEEFTPPQCSPEWTVEAYSAFNITTKPLTEEEVGSVHGVVVASMFPQYCHSCEFHVQTKYDT